MAGYKWDFSLEHHLNRYFSSLWRATEAFVFEKKHPNRFRVPAESYKGKEALDILEIWGVRWQGGKRRGGANPLGRRRRPKKNIIASSAILMLISESNEV